MLVGCIASRIMRRRGTGLVRAST